MRSFDVILDRIVNSKMRRGQPFEKKPNVLATIEIFKPNWWIDMIQPTV